MKADVVEESLLPTKRNRKCQYMEPDERKESIAGMLQELKVLKCDGLAPIKQVEMWQKWGPLLPIHKREITCPRPPQEVIDLVMNERKVKSRKYAQKKKDAKIDNSKKQKTVGDSDIVGPENNSAET